MKLDKLLKNAKINKPEDLKGVGTVIRDYHGMLSILEIKGVPYKNRRKHSILDGTWVFDASETFVSAGLGMNMNKRKVFFNDQAVYADCYKFSSKLLTILKKNYKSSENKQLNGEYYG